MRVTCPKLPYGELTRLEWRKLEAVQTYVNGSMEREYRLEYGYQNQTTVLETVKECADSVCRTAATITYDRVNSGFGRLVRTTSRVSYGFGNGVSSGHIGQTIVLDVDGNGLDDLLFPAPNDRIRGCPPPFDECLPGQGGDWTYHLAIATGDRNDPFDLVDTGLGSTTIYGFPFWCISQATVFDYNGDGRDDLASTCGAYTSGAVLVSTGTGFQPKYNALPTENNAGAFWLVDLNGDDLIDVLTCVPDDRLHFYKGRGPGRGFERTPRVLPNYGQGGVPAPGQWATQPCAAPLMLDIDGDGRTELMKSEYVSARGGSMQDAVWRQRWKALGIGATTARWIDTGLEFDDKLTTAREDEIYRWLLLGGIDAAIALPYAHKWQTKTVDVNGDGHTDILRFDGTRANPVRLWTNIGRGFGDIQRATGGSPVLLGRPEWNWYRMTRYSFARARVVDLNNDGLPEIMAPIGDPANQYIRWVAMPISRSNPFEPTLLGIRNRSAPKTPDTAAKSWLRTSRTIRPGVSPP